MPIVDLYVFLLRVWMDCGLVRLGQGEVDGVTLWVISTWLLLTMAVEIPWLAPGRHHDSPPTLAIASAKSMGDDNQYQCKCC